MRSLNSFIALLSLVTANTQAQPKSAEKLPDMSTFDTYEGIHPAEIGNFWEKWRLVTVRFRKDNDEQRFVYANSIAWKAIQSKAKKFPTGSIFGKVAFKSEPDPSFPVSVVPGAMTRIQIMKKDPKAYAKTGGWGYAIYPADRRGLQSVENVVSSCYACHVTVAKKDYVFSEPVYLTDDVMKPTDFSVGFKSKFKTAALKDLSPYQAKILTGQVPGATQTKVFEMPLFVGSISEGSGPLAEYAIADQSPYLMVDDHSKQYLLAFPKPASKDCPHPGAQLIMMMEAVARPGEPPLPPERRVQRISSVCDGKITNLIDAPVRFQ